MRHDRLATALLTIGVIALGGEVGHPLLRAGYAEAGQPVVRDDEGAVRALLLEVERAVRSGDPTAYTALLVPTADRARAGEFTALEWRGGATRVTLRERDRARLQGTLPDNGYSLTVDVFIEYGNRARVATWRLDVMRVAPLAWGIQDQERLSAIDTLLRLSVNPAQQFSVHDFAVTAEDLELTLAEGTVFTVGVEEQVTGLVLMGRGQMRFRPGPETERGQVKIFAGADTLETPFDAAYVRTGSLALHADVSQLVPQAVDARELRRADQVFQAESAKAFVLDLGDLSSEAWSMSPPPGDFLAEIRTRRFGSLTYVHSGSEPEDISVFDREGQRNISAYTSQEKLLAQGRFYDEDAFATYDVLDYDVDVSFSPDRLWIDGRTRLRLRIRSAFAAQLNVRLADTLAVRSVHSDQFGYLFSLRVKGQDSVLVSLPVALSRNTQITLTVTYGGRLSPQTQDREVLSPGQNPTGGRGIQRRPALDEPAIGLKTEPTYLYSSRSYWYAQAPITDYATATLRISVPPAFDCIASGQVSSEPPTRVRDQGNGAARDQHVFTARRPVRYLAFLVSRFRRSGGTRVAFDASGEAADPVNSGRDPQQAAHKSLDLTVQSNPLQVQRGRQLIERAADIARFYQGIVGDSPYSDFTIALVESTLPGGHSPPHFAALNQPLPNSSVVWNTDPASFDGYPEFFLAHEMAHQWWGQAVGWRNYHEQWLSEGIAQYFAALYAQHHRGDQVFGPMMHQMVRSAIDRSDQGPVYLGYRLGHIERDSRIFRALVYNKSAAVLHMLRRLLGDETFFRGLRRFYAGSRYDKASTEDLRFAMEWESGRSLERFVDRWIYGSTLPQLTFSRREEPSGQGQTLILRFEQTGELFDVPITVTLEYADRRTVDVLVLVTEAVSETRVPLAGPLRSVNLRDDDGTLAEIRAAP